MLGGHRREPRRELAVRRLGVRAEVGAGFSEVAGEGLRQHDEVAVGRDQRGQPGAVGGGVET